MLRLGNKYKWHYSNNPMESNSCDQQQQQQYASPEYDPMEWNHEDSGVSSPSHMTPDVVPDHASPDRVPVPMKRQYTPPHSHSRRSTRRPLHPRNKILTQDLCRYIERGRPITASRLERRFRLRRGESVQLLYRQRNIAYFFEDGVRHWEYVSDRVLRRRVLESISNDDLHTLEDIQRYCRRPFREVRHILRGLEQRQEIVLDQGCYYIKST